MKNQTKYARVPPNNPALEGVTLGAILIDSGALYNVQDILIPETFYQPQNATVFQACLNLSGRNQPIDALTVVEELRRTGELEKAGGPVYVASLTMQVASAANIEHHARILAQFHIRRELALAGMEIEQWAMDPTVDDFQPLDMAEARIFGIAQRYARGAEPPKERQIMQALENINTILKSPSGVVGVPTGFSDMDTYTTGWGNKYIVLAARTSMGKTTTAMEFALAAATAGIKTDYYSISDSSADELIEKAILMIAGVPEENLAKKLVTDLDWQRITEAGELLAGLPLKFYDSTHIGGKDISNIKSAVRKNVLGGTGISFVDFIQRIDVDGYTDPTQVTNRASIGLQQLVKATKKPLIALAQIVRTAESRGGSKRPNMADIKQSGNIEEDADIIATIYRPEYYGILEDENGNSLRGVTEITFLKNRKSGRVPHTFFKRRNPATHRLEDMNAEPTFEQKLSAAAFPAMNGNGGYEDLPF